jgi:hypothetical protein
MKKSFFILIIVAYCTSINFLLAQDTLILNSSGSYKYNIGLFFSSITDDFLNSHQFPVNFNYKIGAKTNIKLTNRISIYTGLGYGYESYNLSGRPVFRTQDLYPSWFQTKTIRTDCQLRFDISRKIKKILFYGLGGPVLNINFYERYNYDLFIIVDKRIRVYNILFLVGAGIEYSINKVALSFEPTFITPIWTNSKRLKHPSEHLNGAYIYPYRLGMNIGLSYKWNFIN